MVGKKGMCHKINPARAKIYTIVVNAKDQKDFFAKYSKEFGETTTPEEMGKALTMWRERTRILKRHPELKKVEPPKNHTTYPPNVVDEETTVLSNISNKLSEIIQLQKEANQIRLSELELFQQLANRGGSK